MGDWSSANLSGEELIGANIVEAALTSPLMRIAENAGANGAVVAENVKSKPLMMVTMLQLVNM